MEIKPVTEFGALKEGLRDVRFGSDGVFDLYTSEVVDPSKFADRLMFRTRLKAYWPTLKPS